MTLGAVYDLVSKRETTLIKRFVSKATFPITFHTANGPTRTENVANIYVRELDENITPYVLASTPSVLTVGYRCMDIGYTFIWPTNQSPYFIRLDGMIIHLTIENYIPYLVPNSAHCRPQKPSGTRSFCSPYVNTSTKVQPGAPGRAGKGNRSTSKIDKNRKPKVATPSDHESVGEEQVDHDEYDTDQSSSDAEHADGLTLVARRSLRDEANSLYHLLTHKPKNPSCKYCRRAKMKDKRKYAGSYKNTATRWGHVVIGDHTA